MKLLKRLIAVAFCAVLACVLVGCQQQEQQKEDDSQLQVKDASVAEPFYVLVVGNDSRTGTVEANKADYADGTARSDVMMLVRVDPKTYAISIISVPRDTATEFNGQKVKLNEVYHSAGIDESMKAVADLTGVTPSYYLDMSFVQFENFIQGLGGINANVPINMHLQDIVSGNQISLNKGTQDLDGQQALVLARSRKQYANDLDACRQIQDRQIVQVGIQKVASEPENVDTYVQALFANCKTNWDQAEAASLIKDFAEHSSQITFTSGTGPYAGEIDPSNGLWLAYRDEATWKKVIEAAENGTDLKAIVPEPSVAAL